MRSSLAPPRRGSWRGDSLFRSPGRSQSLRTRNVAIACETKNPGMNRGSSRPAPGITGASRYRDRGSRRGRGLSYRPDRETGRQRDRTVRGRARPTVHRSRHSLRHSTLERNRRNTPDTRRSMDRMPDSGSKPGTRTRARVHQCRFPLQPLHLQELY
jgi:hypothetical protein